jgi:hypothetical protein
MFTFYAYNNPPTLPASYKAQPAFRRTLADNCRMLFRSAGFDFASVTLDNHGPVIVSDAGPLNGTHRNLAALQNALHKQLGVRR